MTLWNERRSETRRKIKADQVMDKLDLLRATRKDIRDLSKFSYFDFIATMQAYGNLTPDLLEKEMTRPTTTNFELMFCKLVKKASEGSPAATREIFNRFWGPAGQREQVIKHISANHQIILNLPDNGRQEIKDLSPVNKK